MENRPNVWNGVPVPYDASVDELGRQIRGPAPVRWAAFVALAHTPGASALALLHESARSSDPHVRRMAAEAIGVHPDGRRLAAVVRTLIDDGDPAVVRTACEAAARQRLAEAHDSIVSHLSSKHDATRVAVVRALRELWREADVDRVLDVFTNDSSVEVRREAAWTLRSNASASTWRRLFVAWKADALPRHREWACELAAAHGDRDVSPDLRGLMEDDDGHVRERAARAVRELEARR